MTNEEKFKKSFCESLSVSDDKVNEQLEYNGITEWDSIGHMALISSLEEKFSISIETEDVIDFSSYKKGKQILTDKYNIKF